MLLRAEFRTESPENLAQQWPDNSSLGEAHDKETVSFTPRRFKDDHLINEVSRDSVNGFLDFGLKIMSAKPCLYFHQTLSFPDPITDSATAKRMFNRFIKGVLKRYQDYEMAGMYAEERRVDKTLHYHVFFCFFDDGKLPFARTRMYRDFRTDIFKRWNSLNGGKSVHAANELVEHEFNQKSLCYPCRALRVFDTSRARGLTNRKKTNWWGCFNKKIVLSRAVKPTANERKRLFSEFFRKIEGEFVPPKPKAHKWNRWFGANKRRQQERAIVLDYFRSLPSRKNDDLSILLAPQNEAKALGS